MLLRRTLTAALLAGALLAPQIAEAQIGAPLEILCTSYAQEYCLVFLTYDVTFPGPSQARLFSTVQLYGSAISEGSVGVVYWFGLGYTRSFSGEECAVGLQGTLRPIAGSAPGTFGPGHYNLGDSAGGCTLVTHNNRAPSPADITSLGFRIDGVTTACYANGTGGPSDNECVSVPEPTTLPLLVAGLFGLGFVAWRRQEDDSLLEAEE